MIYIYIQFIVAFDLLVALFFVVFNVFPGKWYRWHTVQLQFILSMLSFIIGLSGYILSIYNRNYIQEINSLFSDSFLSIFLAFYFMVFISSIYRYISINKNQNDLPYEYIELSKSQYKIVNELEYSLGNLAYMPNVNSYAVCEKMTIVFSSARPLREIDAGFVCRQIGDDVYECLSYIDKSKEKSFHKIINKTISFISNCLFLLMPVLLTYTDYIFSKGRDIENIYNLYVFSIMFTFGALGSKLFYNSKGLGKWLYWLCISSLILSNYYLFIYFR